MAADMVACSRLMEADEADTLARHKAHLSGLIEPQIADHGGGIVKTTGDGLLAEFTSVVDSIECAIAIQHGMAARNDVVPQDRRIDYRIGVHLGDVIVEGEDIHGDGVNIAARLKGLAEADGVRTSRQAYDQVVTRPGMSFVDGGEHHLKNIMRPLRVRRSAGGAEEAASGETDSTLISTAADRPSIAVLPFENMSGDPEQDYFADGVSEEILTLLARDRWLAVIARNSTFTYKGKSVDTRDLTRSCPGFMKPGQLYPIIKIEVFVMLAHRNSGTYRGVALRL